MSTSLCVRVYSGRTLEGTLGTVLGYVSLGGPPRVLWGALADRAYLGRRARVHAVVRNPRRLADHVALARVRKSELLLQQLPARRRVLTGCSQGTHRVLPQHRLQQLPAHGRVCAWVCVGVSGCAGVSGEVRVRVCACVRRHAPMGGPTGRPLGKKKKLASMGYCEYSHGVLCVQTWGTLSARMGYSEY